jgi:hypothetical protein
MQRIQVVNSNDEDVFTKDVNDLLAKGYRISSTDCGFFDSEPYEFPLSLLAVLVIEEEPTDEA